MIELDSCSSSLASTLFVDNRVGVLCIERDDGDRFVTPNVKEANRDWLIAETPKEVAKRHDSAKANKAVTLSNRFRNRFETRADLAVIRDIWRQLHFFPSSTLICQSCRKVKFSATAVDASMFLFSKSNKMTHHSSPIIFSAKNS